MIVKELIEALDKFPQDAVVTCFYMHGDPENLEYYYDKINTVSEGTPGVVICSGDWWQDGHSFGMIQSALEAWEQREATA